MKKNIIGLLLGLATCVQPVFAADLLEIVALARQNDPTYHQAQSLFNVDYETLPQAHSNVFPILQGSIFRSIYNETKTTTSSSTAPVRINNKNRNYTLSATQPLFNLPALVEIRRAHRVVSKADAEFHAAELDLVIRTATAYFNVLAAKDNVRFLEAQKKSNARQLDQVEQRFKVGLEAITAVHDAKARYDAVVSRVITAQNQVDNTFEALREIVGVPIDSLSPLKNDPPLEKPNPANADEWIHSALQHNYSLIAKRFETEVAHISVSAARSEYAPKLNLVAEYNDNRGRNIGATSVNSVTEDVALQLSTPLFQGINLYSRARQSRAAFEASVADLDRTQKRIVSTTAQTYNSIISGIGAIRADKQAVISAQSSLESSEAAYHIGTRTIVDVLDAEQILYNNQRQLASDTYNTINAMLELKRTTGLLSMDDLSKINAWLIDNNPVHPKKLTAEKSATITT